MLLNKGGKCLAGQGIALYLRKDMVGYDVQLRHQLCTTGAGLEGSRSRRKVVMLNVDDPQFFLLCPVNRFIDFCNDFLVVFRDVVLQVDHDQCTVFHLVFLHKFRVPLYGGVYIRESESSKPRYSWQELEILLQQPVAAFQKIVSQQRLYLRRLSVQLVANIDIPQINRLVLKPKLHHPHIGKQLIL